MADDCAIWRKNTAIIQLSKQLFQQTKRQELPSQGSKCRPSDCISRQKQFWHLLQSVSLSFPPICIGFLHPKVV